MPVPCSARLVSSAPDCPYQRLALYAVRRMAAGGLHDAFAAQALITGFGIDFRRPLLLLRAFMADVAHHSTQTIAVAPCCCPRVTQAESAILAALALADANPAGAHDRLAALLGVQSCTSVAEHARAVAAGFADCGMPLDAM